MLIWIVFIAVACLVAAWAAGFIYSNDFSVRQRSFKDIRTALVVFPHADDETNVAGILWQLTRHGTHVVVVTLTQGERGTPDASLQASLRAARLGEAQTACRMLGVAEHIQQDFGDGQVADHKPELRTYLQQLLAEHQPQLVITYDLAGLYGHPDHIACSETLTELLDAKYPKIHLWYTAWPKRLVWLFSLPEHMAKDPSFRQKRAKANGRIFIGLGVLAKIRTVYAHKSQRRSFRSAMPFGLPIWLVYSLQIFEYIEQVR